MNQDKVILAIGGNRPDNIDGDYTMKTPVWHKLRKRISDTIEIYKPDQIISGPDPGVGLMASMIAIKMDIPLTVAIPYKGQHRYWCDTQKKYYRWILKRAFRIYVADLELICNYDEYNSLDESSYTFAKLRDRNRWMVGNCTRLVVVCRPATGKGNTMNFVRIARDMGRPVGIISPAWSMPEHRHRSLNNLI